MPAGGRSERIIRPCPSCSPTSGRFATSSKPSAAWRPTPCSPTAATSIASPRGSATAGWHDYLKPTLRELSRYIEYLHDGELAPPSIARHLVALKMFYRFLRLEERGDPAAVELLGSPTLWERIPQVLSPAAVEKLLRRPASRATASTCATGRCWKRCTPPAAGRPKWSACDCDDLYLDRGVLQVRRQGEQAADRAAQPAGDRGALRPTWATPRPGRGRMRRGCSSAGAAGG